MRIAEFIAVGVLLCLIGCGGGGSDSTSAAPSRFLYASGVGGPNANPAAIYGFAVYPGGAISSIASSGTATDFGGGPITITRDSKLLYTTYADTVKASEIHPDGSLTNSVSPSFQMPPGTRVSGLVADPAADFLYASSYSTTLSPGVLTVFAIDSATGALSQTSSVTLGNEFIENSAAITPNGRYLYQNDVYPGEGSIPTTLQIAGFSTSTTTGALNPVPGSPLSPTTPATSSIHQMAIEPTGKFLYASYQPFVTKVGDEGGIAAYSIDTASGGLTAVPGSPFDVGLSPYSLAVDASGRFLIVSIENGLAVLSIDPGTGALTPVAGSPFEPVHFYGFVAADPSEPYVYAGTADGHTPTIVVLSIDQATGALAPIGEAAIPDDLAVQALDVSFIATTH